MFIHTHQVPKDILDDSFGNWHVAAFSTKKEDRPTIARWCVQTYGPAGFRVNTYDVRWKDGIEYGEIHFSRKEDLEWFILRWS